MRASPVTGFRITSSSGVLVSADDADDLLPTSAVTAFSVPRRMLPPTPITTAPVNSSVMSSTVQLFDHCVDSLRTSQVQARLVASGDIAPLVPSASLRSSSARPLRVPRRPVQARPSPASALPLALVSALLLALLPLPPSLCSTRPPSLPPALSATQSPWRLPSAGSPGAHPPSLVPLVSSFPTACAGSGSHTRRAQGAVVATARLTTL